MIVVFPDHTHVPFLKPSSKNIFTDRSKVVLLCGSSLLFVFVMLSCLFIAALWSPAGKGLSSWLYCM